MSINSDFLLAGSDESCTNYVAEMKRLLSAVNKECELCLLTVLCISAF